MARRRKAEEHVNHERWLVTYADLITLLTVFFIVLYSVTNADLEKFQRLAGSLANAFDTVGALPGSKPVKPAVGGGDGILSIFESQVGDTANGGVGVSNVGQRGESDVQNNRDEDFRFISTEIAKLVTARGLTDRVSVTQNQEGIVINLAGDLLFFNARADLRPESFPVLDRIAELLQPLPNPIRIEGHTDSISPKNPAFLTNWHLSGARALGVLQFLEQFGELERGRLHFQAWADLKPVANNESLDGRLRNRRASIVILYPDRKSVVRGTGAQPAVTPAPVTPPRIFPIGVFPGSGSASAVQPVTGSAGP